MTRITLTRAVLMHEHPERVLCGGTKTLAYLNINTVHPGTRVVLVLCSCTNTRKRVLCGGTETLVCLNTNPVHPGCCAYRHGHPPASALWGHRDPGVFEHNIVHSRVLCSCTDSAGTEGLVCLNTNSTTQGLALMMWVLRSSDVGLTDEGKTRVVLCGL